MFQPVNIRRYLALMQSRGFDAAAVLDGSGIDAARLQDPAYLVDLEQCQRVVSNMITLSGEPSLGLSFGRALRIADFGIVGHALLSSKSIRQSIQLWLQYSRSLIDTLIRLRLEDHADGSWSLHMSGVTAASQSIDRFSAEELLVIGLRIITILTGETMQVGRLRLSYAAQGQEAQYRELFGCEAQFNAERTEILVLAPQLDQPLRHNADELSEVCLRHCSQVMRQIADGSPILSRLRSILLRNTNEPPTAAQAAQALGMSERTLRRRLAASGASYQAVLDEFRRDLASEYFCSGQMKPKEVAYLLGYRSVSTFRRAFKTWTGQTIGDFVAAQRRA